MGKMTIVISPELMNEVESSQTYAFKIPADAKKTGTTAPGVVPGSVGDKAKYTWTELLEIVDTKMYADEKHAGTAVFEVRLKVPNDSPFVTNIGKAQTQWYRVDTEAIKAGDKNAGRYKMTLLSISRLKSLVAACGHPMAEGVGLNLGIYFDTSEDNPQPDLCILGHRVFATIYDRPDKTQDGEPIRRQEPSRFTPESEG
jgi:hypothetical protein